MIKLLLIRFMLHNLTNTADWSLIGAALLLKWAGFIEFDLWGVYAEVIRRFAAVRGLRAS